MTKTLSPQVINARIKIFKVIDLLGKARLILPNKEKKIGQELSDITQRLLEKYN